MNQMENKKSQYENTEVMTKKAYNQRLRRMRESFTDLGMVDLERLFNSDSRTVNEIISEFIEFLDNESKNSAEGKQHMSELKKFKNKSKIEKITEFFSSKVNSDKFNEDRQRIKQDTLLNNKQIKKIIREIDLNERLSYEEKLLMMRDFILESVEFCPQSERRNNDRDFNIVVGSEYSLKKIDKLLFIEQSLEFLKEVVNQFIIVYLANASIKIDKRKEGLEMFYNEIKKIGEKIKQNITSKEKVTITGKKQIYQAFFDFIYLYNAMYSDEIAMKAKEEVMKDKLKREPSMISLKKTLEIYKKGISSQREVTDGIKENRFIKRVDKIKTIINFYNIYYGRKLFHDNIKNLKGMYFEIYLSNHEYSLTGKEKKIRIRNFVEEICEKSTFEEDIKEIIQNVKWEKSSNGLEIGFLPEEIRSEFHNSQNKYYEEVKKMIEEKELDFAILSEKITRGNYLVEGNSLEEYKFIKMIECQLHNEIKNIFDISSIDGKMEFVEIITKELLIKLGECIQRMGLENVKIAQIRDFEIDIK